MNKFVPLLEPIPITEHKWPEGILPMVYTRTMTYNHELYIRECIEGILMQKTTFPVQVLIHDDASTDSTPDIVREYERRYPQLIKVYYQDENSYSSPQKNQLRAEFSSWKVGKYEAPCEGDDYWIDPLKLQKQFEFLETNPDYSMCFHNAIIITTSETKKNADIFNNYCSDCDLTFHDLINKWVVPTASVMFIRELCVLPEWMVRIYSGDFSMLLTLYIKGKIKYLDMISSVYRKDLLGNSISTKINSNFVREQQILLLDSFNNGTNRLYDTVITKRINYLSKEIAIRKAIWGHKYYKLIFILPQIWRNRKTYFKN